MSIYIRCKSFFITFKSFLKTSVSSVTPDFIHDLSEGYGFVLSLQFTDYFTNSEVNSMLEQMMEGDGFWDITVEELNSMVTQIETAAGICCS